MITSIRVEVGVLEKYLEWGRVCLGTGGRETSNKHFNSPRNSQV